MQADVLGNAVSDAVTVAVCSMVPAAHIAAMGGRAKLIAGLEQADARAACKVSSGQCALCERVLGRKVEWHHRIPKSRGGTEVLAFHPICHRTIQARVSNYDLASAFAELDALRAFPDASRCLRWIADKPPDFHAPTRREASVHAILSIEALRIKLTSVAREVRGVVTHRAAIAFA